MESEGPSLEADCSSCFGLCCVVHALRRSADFALDKPAGSPCTHLSAGFACGIHDTLPEEGFGGCAAYTCFGAGQRVAQETFGGVDWRQAPETAELMFATFMIMRQLHELMWAVTEALSRCSPGTERDDLQDLLSRTELLAATPAGEMSWGDVDHHCRVVEARLSRT